MEKLEKISHKTTALAQKNSVEIEKTPKTFNETGRCAWHNTREFCIFKVKPYTRISK